MKLEGPTKRARSAETRQGNGAMDPSRVSPAEEVASPEKSKLDFFSWLLGMTRREFFRDYFEKQHCLCLHGSATFFATGVKGFIPPVDWSTERMLQLVKEKDLHYGTDLNIVRFDATLGERINFKVEGVVTVQEMLQCMEKGWSVRFLRPHEFIASNSAFISLMESEFNCYCGLNSYWTSSNSQGFAPHYDDVDVFLLQLEGEKEWRLYDPLEDAGFLCRHSSEDYKPEQFPKPKHAFTLKAGDVLYMPRGMVHQGATPPHTHSLHVTFSANQMNTWADLFLRTASHCIETLAANHLEWRRTLPPDATTVLGGMHHPAFRRDAGIKPLTARQGVRRAELQHQFRELAAELALFLTDEPTLDLCTDVYAKDTLAKLQPFHAAHRPRLLPRGAPLHPTDKVCLPSKNCCRLLLNVAGEAQLFHSGTNTVVCLRGQMGELRFEAEFAPAIATLLARFPRGIAIMKLPFTDFENSDDVAENQMLLCETLRDANLLELVPS